MQVLLPLGCSFLVVRFERSHTFKPKDASLFEITASLRLHLLSLSKRSQRVGYATTRFSLRMTREEIGSYLGLTLETVSRLFSRLHREGVLSAHQRDIELNDIAKLRVLVGH
jgi:CRP-like cAMP-binding protein